MARAASKPRGLQQRTVASSFRLTHPERVVFPDSGITKLAVAEYYALVAEKLLPHVAGRPLAVVRCPAGIAGQCFYQKHPPTGLPDSVERIRIQEKDETDTYLVVHDAAGLMALVQFGTLELHPWGSRSDNIERPDRMIFDLDPDSHVSWSDVIGAAFQFRQALKQLGLVSFVKLTGGQGLHVVAPIDRRTSWSDLKQFSRSLANTMADVSPGLYTANPSKAARGGKIFIDYLRNERGATAVAPYSIRARPGAPVAMPLKWNDLRSTNSAHDFTLKNAPQSLARRKLDPWAEMLRIRQALPNLARMNRQTTRIGGSIQ